MNLSIQPKIFAALLIAVAALLVLAGQHFWNSYRYTPSAGLTADISSDLAFVVDDSYQTGQEVPVRISNSASVSYTAYLHDENCNFELYDESGKIILQDYRAEVDSYTIVDIGPEKTTELCTLKLTECTDRSRSYCRNTESLKAGAYTMFGKFFGRKGLETVIKKEFRVTD